MTGASGWLGAATARALERAGADVVRLVRDERTGATAVDLTARGATARLSAALTGCDAIVHAAARVHRPVEDQRERQLMHLVNARGTELTVEAAERARVPRFVYVSTIGVYDFASGLVHDEDDPPAPATAYGATKWLGESAVRASRLDGRVVRLATLAGRGDVANFARMARAIAGRRFVIPGAGAARKSWVAIEDAAELLAATALAEQLPHATFHLAHPSPITVREAADTLARCLSVARPPSVPLAIVRAASRASDLLSRAVGHPLSLQRSLGALTTDSVVRTERLRACFPSHRFRTFAEVTPCYVPPSDPPEAMGRPRSPFE